MAHLFKTLAAASIGEASHTSSSHMQTSLLEHSKTLAENGLQLMYAVKEAGGNPKREQAHAKVDEGVRMVSAAVADLVSLLEKVESEAGFIAGVYVCVLAHLPPRLAYLHVCAPICVRNGGPYQQSTVASCCRSGGGSRGELC